MMQLKHGIFDDASVRDHLRYSSGGLPTRGKGRRRPAISSEYRCPIHARAVPFEEDEWVGGVLTLGDEDDTPAVVVTMRDIRCAMVNIDPDNGSLAPEVLKAAIPANQNNEGLYGTVTRIGRLAVGQTIVLHPSEIP